MTGMSPITTTFTTPAHSGRHIGSRYDSRRWRSSSGFHKPSVRGDIRARSPYAWAALWGSAVAHRRARLWSQGARELMIGAMRDGYHAVREKLPLHVLHPYFPVFRTALHLENLRTVGREIGHDALVAVVAERERIDLGCAVPVIEQRFLTRGIPDRTDTAAHEHEVPLLGREDRFVPVYDGKLVMGAHQDIPGVQGRVAQHERVFTLPQRPAELRGARHHRANLVPLLDPERRQAFRDRVVVGARFDLLVVLLHDVSPARRIVFAWHEPV